MFTAILPWQASKLKRDLPRSLQKARALCYTPLEIGGAAPPREEEKGLGIDLVGKIGSMALIQREEGDMDYNIFARLGRELKPGMVWVSSGATEIGRLDYLRRTGTELAGPIEQVKTDYAAQGQAILMENYRRYIAPEYSVRQILVEHTHFNKQASREFIRELLLRCPGQGAIPIVNYNDPVSFEENRKMELSELRKTSQSVVECVDNDETAAVIAELVGAKTLLILTSADGIYRDADDPSTLVRELSEKDPQRLENSIRLLQQSCVGASREGAGGARAKLEYILPCAKLGTHVVIGSPRHRIEDLLAGRVPATHIRLEG